MHKKNRLFYQMVFIFLACQSLINKKVFPQNGENKNDAIPNIIYYDADQVTFNRNTNEIELEGNATFLLGRTYIYAQRVRVSQQQHLVSAEGNVQLINHKQKATATRIVFDMATKQMRMDNAQIFSDPNIVDETVSEETLGLSKAEIAFDSARTARTSEFEQQLKKLRETFVNQKNLLGLKPHDAVLKQRQEDTKRRYAQVLARMMRTKYQPNAYLAALDEKEKSKLLTRREAVERFNRDNPNIVNKVANFTPVPGYLKLAAGQIIQKDASTFILNDALVTSCRCSSFGEPPIYGFSTNSAKIEMGDYVTMQGATFDVFSVPTFYFPWVKISIKNKRETGFLAPSGYVSNNAGQALTVPFFLVLGPHADATLTYQNFSQRGSRFQGELRTQLSDESQILMRGEWIQDKAYHEDWLANNNKIDAQIAQDPASAARYESYRGKDLQNRWYSENSINTDLSENVTLHGKGEFVSDNTYLSDFSTAVNISQTATLFGNTSPTSKRFLTQELDGEYLGDNVSLSVRGQRMQDLFANDQGNTPIRVPRVEFTLLPSRYFNTPFVLSNISTTEKVIRPGTENGTAIAFSQGERLHSTTRVALPLPDNDYVNAYVAAQATGTQFHFGQTSLSDEQSPGQGYMEYLAHVDMPFYSRLDFASQDQNTVRSVRQDITPFVDFSYLPNVKKSDLFPTTYQLWYQQDAVNSGAYLKFGVSTSWKIKKEVYKAAPESFERLWKSKDSGVGNIAFFTQAVEHEGLNVSSQPESIFQLSSESQASHVYEDWARRELADYEKKIAQDESTENYIWPQGERYKLVTEFEMVPLSLSLSTNYNFLASQTARELNANGGPTFNPLYPVTRFGNIILGVGWNLAPIINVNGGFQVSYNQVYERIDSANASIQGMLPYGFQVSYYRNIQYDANPNDPAQFIERTQSSAGISYNPTNWVQFGYQWSESTDPAAPPTDTSDGRSYASSYNISFTNLQDCFDLAFLRNKAAGVPERQATYAVGINMKLFGYSVGYSQVGDYLNRKLQD